MNITELFNAKAIAAQYTVAASNRIPYLGAGLFPGAKKMGLDLRLIKGHKGQNVQLAPSNFDAKATLRGRGIISVENVEMAFFREAMLVSEQDQQDIMRIQSSGDPYTQTVLAHIFDDVNTLVDSANMVPEIMRMQLLCPENGSPSILMQGKDGVVYRYNYDPDGTYAANNFVEIQDNAWNTSGATPLSDMRSVQNTIEANTGSRPAYALMNRTTFEHMLATDEIRNAALAQNLTANVFMDDDLAKAILKKRLGLIPVLYDKVYADHAGSTQKFYKDGFVTLLPAGALGNTWYGVTPEERGGKDVSVVNTGVAVSVIHHENPVNTETVVSEIVLPSYERMSETAVLKVY